MKINTGVQKLRAGDDRVCSPTTSFFNNKKNSALAMNNIEKEIMSAKFSIV